MSLGYNFTNVLATRLRGRVSLTAQNAFVITKYTGIDPEVGASGSDNSLGIDNNIYPRPRTFLLGLNLTF